MLEGFELRTVGAPFRGGGATCAECGNVIKDRYVVVPVGDFSVVHCVPCGEVLHEVAKVFL